MLLNKLIRNYEDRNTVKLNQKTPMQQRIEFIVTNGIGYERIPYVKFLGEKIALKTWLKFSRERFMRNSNYIQRLSSLDIAKRYFEREIVHPILAYLLKLK